MALSVSMSASSFAGFPRCALTLTRNVAFPAVVLCRSSLIASNKMFASGDLTNIDFQPSQPSAALGCRTSKAWTLSLGCHVTPDKGR